MFNTNDYSIPIISDDHVKKLGCGQHSPPNHWHSRRLYVGQKGADNWLNLVHHSSYPLQGADPFDLNKNRSAALDMISVATMVSLGAGDAHHDVPIVEQLQINMPRLKYIPLDISIYLLESAIQNLKTYVSIPAGLLCDFEQVPVSIIHMIADLSKKPILFSMLGGTVGNLDLGEKHFFETIHNLMGKNDRLLIDVPLAGPAWTAEEDPRYNKTEYTEEFMRFLVHGITESNGYLDSRTLMGAVKGRIDCRIGNIASIARISARTWSPFASRSTRNRNSK